MRPSRSPTGRASGSAAVGSPAVGGYGPAMTNAPTASRLSAENRPRIISGICGVLIAIGVFLPWISITGLPNTAGYNLSRTGIDTDDGSVILVLAIIGLICLGFARGARWGGIAQLVVAALIWVIALADIVNPISESDAISNLIEDHISIRAGLWIIIIAAGVWVLTAIWQILRPARRRSRGDTPVAADEESPGVSS